MALLAPLQLDPEFGCMYEGLRCVMRFMRNPVHAAELRRRYLLQPKRLVDGPTARLCSIAEGSVLGLRVQQLLMGKIDEEKWLHDLREDWRNFVEAGNQREISSL